MHVGTDGEPSTPKSNKQNQTHIEPGMSSSDVHVRERPNRSLKPLVLEAFNLIADRYELICTHSVNITAYT